MASTFQTARPLASVSVESLPPARDLQRQLVANRQLYLTGTERATPMQQLFHFQPFMEKL